MGKIIQDITSFDGVALRVARFLPQGDVQGVLQIVHGFGEAIIHYERFAEFFVNAGYAVVIHEQRGFGELATKKTRGVIRDYDDFLADLLVVKGKIDEWFSGVPVSIFGHSMGGNILSNLLIKKPQSQAEYKSAIIQCPWLALYKPLAKPVVGLAGCLGKLSGKLAIPSGLDVNSNTRDSLVVEGLKTDGVFHDRISFRLLSQVLKHGKNAIENVEQIKLPVLLLNAGTDIIVCPKATREFASKAGANFTYLEYPESYHLLHYDVNGGEALAEMLGFVGA